eukprot:scaffold158038_cov30-Tisochrysis_lutea.AAC.3
MLAARAACVGAWVPPRGVNGGRGVTVDDSNPGSVRSDSSSSATLDDILDFCAALREALAQVAQTALRIEPPTRVERWQLLIALLGAALDIQDNLSLSRRGRRRRRRRGLASLAQARGTHAGEH